MVAIVVIGGFVLCHVVAVNHEPRASLVQDPLHEFAAKATESIFVGNHNLCDQSCVDGVQKGDKMHPFEIEPASDILDVFVVRVVATKECGLAIEITMLMGTTDASVTDSSSGSDRFSVRCDPEEGLDVRELVKTLAVTVGTESVDLASFGPCPQGGTRYCICLL